MRVHARDLQRARHERVCFGRGPVHRHRAHAVCATSWTPAFRDGALYTGRGPKEDGPNLIRCSAMKKRMLRQVPRQKHHHHHQALVLFKVDCVTPVDQWRRDSAVAMDGDRGSGAALRRRERRLRARRCSAAERSALRPADRPTHGATELWLLPTVDGQTFLATEETALVHDENSDITLNHGVRC